MGLHQNKKLLYSKRKNINKIQRQLMEWETIFKNHISDKELASKRPKKLIQLSCKKTQIVWPHLYSLLLCSVGTERDTQGDTQGALSVLWYFISSRNDLDGPRDYYTKWSK